MALTASGYQWYNFPSGPSYYEFWEDFETTSGADSTATWLTLGWDLDVDTGTAATTDADGVTGNVVLATTAADNKWAQIQRQTESFALTQGKTTDFIIRLAHSVVLTDCWAAGLFLNDDAIMDTVGAATGVGANMAVSDGVFFASPEADSGVYGGVLRDSILAVTGSLATLANATNVILGFRVTMDGSTAGTGVVQFYINGNLVGSINSTTLPYSAEETLAPAIALIARSTVGSTLTADYVGGRQQR